MASITDLADLFPGKPEQPVDLAAQFTEHLTSWLTEDYAKLQKVREPGLHASSLWKTCARQVMLLEAFKQHLKSEVMQAGNFLTFDVGHALHHWWQNNYLGPMQVLYGDWYCKRCDKVVHTGLQPQTCPVCNTDRRVVLDYAESSVRDDEMGYVGHCDGVLHLGDYRAVFEFKTASPSEFEKLDKPKVQHVVQAHAYMHGLKLQHTLVVYQNKGRQCSWTKDASGWHPGKPELRVFHVKFDQTLWDNYVKRCKDYKEANELVRSLPVVTPKDANRFERICAHARSTLAEECPMVKQCFAP